MKMARLPIFFNLHLIGRLKSFHQNRTKTKVTKNILHCLNNGTEMGWLIDPDEKTIFVSQPQQQTLVVDSPQQQVPVPAFANELQLTVAEIFKWLLD